MDRASAIILGALGVVLLSIAALFWVLTGDDGGDTKVPDLFNRSGGTAAAPVTRSGGTVDNAGEGSARPSSTSPTVTVGGTTTSVAVTTSSPSSSTPTSSPPTTATTSTSSPPTTSTSSPPTTLSPALTGVLARIDAGGILFAYRSAALSPSATALLNELATLLMREPSVRLTISGHTDAHGTAGENVLLSARRAGAVQDYLVAQAVLIGRLEVRAAGPFEPVADNNTDEGRSANRRVEIHAVGGNP